MNERIRGKLRDVLYDLLPDNDIEIHADADLRDSPNPVIKDLCETAELIIRLSKEERA